MHFLHNIRMEKNMFFKRREVIGTVVNIENDEITYKYSIDGKNYIVKSLREKNKSCIKIGDTKKLKLNKNNFPSKI